MTDLTRGKFAIIVRYTDGQTTPNTPDNKLLFVPDDEEARTKVLKDHYRQITDAPGLHDVYITVTTSTRYGDIGVMNTSDEHQGVRPSERQPCLHLYLTFITNCLQEWALFQSKGVS